MKPAVACICRDLEPVPNRTGIHIVQHMRERGHAIGTARIAALGLSRVRLRTVFPAHGRFCCDADFPENSALLYPTKDARHLESLPGDRRPRHLVVIDGTWPQASKIYRDSPVLQSMPCVTFGSAKASNYRIRQEPRLSANATIEAICRALVILEPDTTGVEGLLACFDRMIDRQIAASRIGRRRMVERAEPKPRRDVPKSLCDPTLDVVIACGVRGRTSPASEVRWQWSALRLDSLDAFSAIIPQTPTEGFSLEAFQRSWQRFIRPTDVLTTWHNKTLGHLFALTNPHPRFVSLKAAVGNLRRGRFASLDSVMEAERLMAPRLPTDGFSSDAADCLEKLAAVVAFLQRYAASQSQPGSHSRA